MIGDVVGSCVRGVPSIGCGLTGCVIAESCIGLFLKSVDPFWFCVESTFCARAIILMNATTHAVIIIFFMDEYFKVKTIAHYKKIVPCSDRSILDVLNCGLQNRFHTGEFFVVSGALLTFFPLRLSLSPSS